MSEDFRSFADQLVLSPVGFAATRSSILDPSNRPDFVLQNLFSSLSSPQDALLAASGALLGGGPLAVEDPDDSDSSRPSSPTEQGPGAGSGLGASRSMALASVASASASQVAGSTASLKSLQPLMFSPRLTGNQPGAGAGPSARIFQAPEAGPGAGPSSGGPAPSGPGAGAYKRSTSTASLSGTAAGGAGSSSAFTYAYGEHLDGPVIRPSAASVSLPPTLGSMLRDLYTTAGAGGPGGAGTDGKGMRAKASAATEVLSIATPAAVRAFHQSLIQCRDARHAQIVRLCTDHYEAFVSSVEKLQGSHAAAIGLAESIRTLAECLEGSGNELLLFDGYIEKVNRAKKNITRAKGTLHRARLTVLAVGEILSRTHSKKYYAAIRTCERLYSTIQNMALTTTHAPLLHAYGGGVSGPSSSTAGRLGDGLNSAEAAAAGSAGSGRNPLLSPLDQSVVLFVADVRAWILSRARDELQKWLEQIRSVAQEVGRARLQAAILLLGQSTQTLPQSGQIFSLPVHEVAGFNTASHSLTAITSMGAASPAGRPPGSVISDMLASTPIIESVEDLVSFVPLYRSQHIAATLGTFATLAQYYAKNRKLQLDLALTVSLQSESSSTGLSPGEGGSEHGFPESRRSLGSPGPRAPPGVDISPSELLKADQVLSDVVGFFAIEAAAAYSWLEHITDFKLVSELWVFATQRLLALLAPVINSVHSKQSLLALRCRILAFVSAATSLMSPLESADISSAYSLDGHRALEYLTSRGALPGSSATGAATGAGAGSGPTAPAAGGPGNAGAANGQAVRAAPLFGPRSTEQEVMVAAAAAAAAAASATAIGSGPTGALYTGHLLDLLSRLLAKHLELTTPDLRSILSSMTALTSGPPHDAAALANAPALLSVETSLNSMRRLLRELVLFIDGAYAFASGFPHASSSDSDYAIVRFVESLLSRACLVISPPLESLSPADFTPHEAALSLKTAHFMSNRVIPKVAERAARERTADRGVGVHLAEAELAAVAAIARCHDFVSRCLIIRVESCFETFYGQAQAEVQASKETGSGDFLDEQELLESAEAAAIEASSQMASSAGSPGSPRFSGFRLFSAFSSTNTNVASGDSLSSGSRASLSPGHLPEGASSPGNLSRSPSISGIVSRAGSSRPPSPTPSVTSARSLASMSAPGPGAGASLGEGPGSGAADAAGRFRSGLGLKFFQLADSEVGLYIQSTLSALDVPGDVRNIVALAVAERSRDLLLGRLCGLAAGAVGSKQAKDPSRGSGAPAAGPRGSLGVAPLGDLPGGARRSFGGPGGGPGAGLGSGGAPGLAGASTPGASRDLPNASTLFSEADSSEAGVDRAGAYAICVLVAVLTRSINQSVGNLGMCEALFFDVAEIARVLSLSTTKLSSLSLRGISCSSRTERDNLARAIYRHRSLLGSWSTANRNRRRACENLIKQLGYSV
ncbi:hypothetical protein H696_03847 [Fonticula alba]|uniref:Exocyst complex component EXOC6/Sec15 N-terminal domain-containing protein n=1 Tax=Fonticula alba TaxID=691883 RepID=A0A058Z5M8_FONAL|nr:hypothetical protein H696_03847 [Fonticula alba]KCV69416.1 hypothetical protein H696_03847 [Fonticula alba]|eukprot:XP_009495981.1 hypothetical protein H696_03847 [Fonticula alba]